MKNLVIGSAGQIGSALVKILQCDGYDIADEKTMSNQHYDVLHISIPYTDNFISIVEKYIKIYEPNFTVIHSTVPVGTCGKFDKKFNIVYSPCRGVHPELERGIRTFAKYFAGEKAQEASKIFSQKIQGDCTYSNYPNAIESLEAAKLWDTTQYGWNIVLEKAIHEYCENKGIDFELVYTMFNKSYNNGYQNLGMPQYKKYILEHREGKIGGHCVMANLELLDSKICDIIKELNSGREFKSAV